jgi:hypothetical protein
MAHFDYGDSKLLVMASRNSVWLNQATFQYNVGQSLITLELKNTNHVCQANGLWRKPFWVHSLKTEKLNPVSVCEWIM